MSNVKIGELEIINNIILNEVTQKVSAEIEDNTMTAVAGISEAASKYFSFMFFLKS